MHSTFTKEPLHIDDVVVYLKNERTGSSTTRKCKFIGHIVGFTDTKARIHRLSPPDTFVTPDELQDLGIDTIYPDDVVCIVISKYQEDDHTEILEALNNIINKQSEDIYQLIGMLFSSLEDEGVNPWTNKKCMEIANKHWYTEENYKKYLSTFA
jgi:hypothetical protein